MLLPPACGIDSREGEEVLHAEGGAGRGQRRLPLRLLHQVGGWVALQEADQDLDHDRAPNRAQLEAVGDELRLLEDVVPKRRRGLEAVGGELGEVGSGERRYENGTGDGR